MFVSWSNAPCIYAVSSFGKYSEVGVAARATSQVSRVNASKSG